MPHGSATTSALRPAHRPPTWGREQPAAPGRRLLGLALLALAAAPSSVHADKPVTSPADRPAPAPAVPAAPAFPAPPAHAGKPAPRPPTAADAVPVKPPLVIAAAASLTELLPQLGRMAGMAKAPVFRFDATPRIARQIETGAATDLVFSADNEWMDHLARAGKIVPGTRVDLLGNSLVVVVPRMSRTAPRNPSELTADSIERLALAGETVPAGRYARAALASTGVWAKVKGKVVSGDSVRTALAWVARSEASAAIVYATDARVEPRVKVAFVFDAHSHPPIVYSGAVVKGAAQPEEARRFLEFFRSRPAQALIEAAGFSTLSGAAPR